MEAFAEYGHAIASLALTAVFAALIGPIAAVKGQAAGAVPGSLPAPDYANPAYRWGRAYLNLTEMMGIFAAATVAAVLSGASPFWVNLLASVFFVSRLAVFVVHVRGWGRPDAGLRTLVFTIGWACVIVLALMALVAVV